jgi:hypothetical protein
MLDVLKKLNRDKDRCALIGRNALNLHLAGGGFPSKKIFSTMDFDVLCPDAKTALECQEMLVESGFTKNGATFTGKSGELDILIADTEYPEGVIGEYYNIPSLRPLWDARERRRNGILSPSDERLILDKLLNFRENEGKDIETVGVYFALKPEKFEPFLKIIDGHTLPEEREKMLFSLYQIVSGDEKRRTAIENIMLSDIGGK